MRNLVLLPEALVLAMAVLVMLSGRFGWIPRASSAYLPQATALVVLIALGVELWAGATLTTFFGGALVQDRFALFAKAAALLTAAVALAATGPPGPPPPRRASPAPRSRWRRARKPQEWG